MKQSEAFERLIGDFSSHVNSESFHKESLPESLSQHSLGSIQLLISIKENVQAPGASI